MKRTYEFDLYLNEEPTDKQVERLYGHSDAGGEAPPSVLDMTLSGSGGTWRAGCTVEADSFEAALRDVLPALRREGVTVERAEVDREGLALMEAA